MTDVSCDQRAESILEQALVLRLAISAGEQPYLVPLSFGYERGRLFFHSAPRGKKIEMLAQNPRVCFQVDQNVSLVRGKTACQFSMRYRSVIGYGRARRLEDLAEKRHALDQIVRHYGGDPVDYPEDQLRDLAVYEIAIDEITCKSHNMES